MKRFFRFSMMSVLLLAACTDNNHDGKTPDIVSDIKLSETEFTVPASGKEFTVYYSILNAVEGAAIEVTTDEEWIVVNAEVEGVIGLYVAANTELKEGREGVVFVKYAEADHTITVKQEGFTNSTQSDLVGTWQAVGDRWNLDAVSACYLMDGDGFAFDDDGNYVTITVREYCQQYADDWNTANPDSEIKATAEIMAEKLYEDMGVRATMTVTEDSVTFEWGHQYVLVTFVKGAYNYDVANGVMQVDDRAVTDDPRNLKIKVFTDEQGYRCFEWPEFYLFNMTSFDGSKEYWIYASTIFFCEKRKEE